MACNRLLRIEGKQAPRTCADCGIGKCRLEVPSEGTVRRESPNGFFYRVADGELQRCRLGGLWEPVKDIPLYPKELRFIAETLEELEKSWKQLTPTGL